MMAKSFKKEEDQPAPAPWHGRSRAREVPLRGTSRCSSRLTVRL